MTTNGFVGTPIVSPDTDETRGRHPLLGGFRRAWGRVPTPGARTEVARANRDATDGTSVPWEQGRVTFPARIIQSKTEEQPC